MAPARLLVYSAAGFTKTFLGNGPLNMQPTLEAGPHPVRPALAHDIRWPWASARHYPLETPHAGLDVVAREVNRDVPFKRLALVQSTMRKHRRPQTFERIAKLGGRPSRFSTAWAYQGGSIRPARLRPPRGRRSARHPFRRMLEMGVPVGGAGPTQTRVGPYKICAGLAGVGW